MRNEDSLITFPPGTVIFREGDSPDFAYVVMKGEVEISSRRQDGRVILSGLAPHQLFGDLALLEHTPRSATATTVKGCELLAISKEQFFKKLDKLDPFTRYWVHYLADRVKDLTNRVSSRT